MATQSSAGEPSRSLVRVAVIGAIGGVIAGMMMAMVEMIYGGVSQGRTFWDAPMAIWAWVAGMDSFGAPGDHVGSILLGLVGHMMMSMGIGAVFAMLMSRVFKSRDVATPVLLGLVYGLVVWVVMRYVVLPLNAGTRELFTTDLVSPQWVWWLAHAVLGMTAGVYYILVRNRVGAR